MPTPDRRVQRLHDLRDELLLPGEVAKMFNVSHRTVRNWANQGLLTVVRTLGGHRRFYRVEVEELYHRGEDT